MQSGNGRDGASAAEVFDVLWDTLADVLGTAAAATLLRRAMHRAAARIPWQQPIVIVRAGADYTYRLPEEWQRAGDDEAVDALRILAAELRVLLVELTGPVVVTRLGQVAAFRKWGIDFTDDVLRD
jgi:hypothetical protein